MKLLGCGVRLVRQVVAAAHTDGRVNQLACPDRHAVDSVVTCALLVIKHKGKGLATCPSKQRTGVRPRMPYRHIERVDFVALQHIGQLRHEFIEALNRDEVFLQHISGVFARRGLKLCHVVARFKVAPMHLAKKVKQRVDQILTSPFTHGRFSHSPNKVTVDRVSVAALLKAARLGGGFVGTRPGD